MVRWQELKSAVFSDFLVRGGGGGAGCPPIFMLRRMATQPQIPHLLLPLPPLFCSTTCALVVLTHYLPRVTEIEFSLQYQYKIKETGDMNKERYQLS